ncbi:L-type lectin-domain containing receptor kinase S.1-like [Macadamia integrifolia]|uniref:L-type lectin-domain containing receptor kinase S.1-like n=1 Tax=Macadamia integrifolia TaxID=60698 RepID=UPI001C4F319E|nr:L-type lectin-domain containing receptor kinase S.1-like [Macadamia integrifolia]
MALRLETLLPRLISDEQGAFQKGKMIHGNISVASELANLMFSTSRGGGLGLKIDIRKAVSERAAAASGQRLWALASELANVIAPTAASDVYSYGVFVLEVACGRRPIEKSSDDEPLLIDWVKELYAKGRLIEAADSRIAREYKVEDMEAVLKIGLACCHPDPDRRPTMREVVDLWLMQLTET